MIFQSVLIALDMIRQHKLRAALTMLGVIIGVMSVTMIILISNGFQAYLDGQFKKLGADTMFIFFDPGRRGRGDTTGGIDKLTTDDMKFVMQRCSTLDIASGMMSVPAQTVKFEDKSMDSPKIYATDENFQELNRFGLLSGRTLSAADINDRANVVVIGTDIRDRLFPGASGIGKAVILNGIALEVVGVLEKSDFMGDSTSKLMLMPITTAQAKWVGGKKLDIIMMRAKKGVNIDSAMDSAWAAMMVRSNNRAIYRVDSRQSILNALGGVVGGAGVVLAAVAALSLLVGGIGIMNIMLVSVTERTKEIGLRKALGARQYAIMAQFLVESATLSLVGGLIGMGIAAGLGQLVGLLTALKQWPTAGGLQTPFPLMAGLFAAAFSAFIGVVFGLYPAMNAARLDPIVALRRE